MIDYTKGSCLKEGNELAILSVGTTALTVSEALQERSDAKRIAHFDLGPKTLDEALLKAVFTQYKNIITVRSCAGEGLKFGFKLGGSAVFAKNKTLGLPDTLCPTGLPLF